MPLFKHSTSFLGALALTSLLVLPGCGGDGGDDAVTTSRPAEAATPVDDILTVASSIDEEPGERFSYNMIGKRDPFRSFISIEVVRGDSDSPLGPLQLHEIDQYTLSGVVWNMDQPKALIEDPEGIGHVVELGTLVGKNWGRITQIKPSELIITEEYRDPIENELIINEITMLLPDPSLGDD
jgi:type IV pilus assembly protein PilP